MHITSWNTLFLTGQICVCNRLQKVTAPLFTMNHNVLETSSIVTDETFDTWETSSSASTAWGPGTLSGRAIKSLGEASLRGLEKIAIRWRFAKIKSDLPSPGSRDRHHGDTTNVPQIPNEKLEKIMDDLLELSR